MLKQVIGGLLALFTAWQLWQAVDATATYVARGAPLGDALSDPATLLRCLGYGTAMVGGILAVLSKRRAVLVAGVGAGVVLLLGLAILGMGADISLWGGNVRNAVILIVGVLAMAFIPVHKTKSSD